MIYSRGWFRAATAAIFFSLLSACGGGGGGGGGSDSPAPTPADEPNAYFPTSSTLRWDYTSNSTPTSVSLSFAEDRVSNGIHIHALQFPTGGKEYYATSATQLKLKGLYLPQILVNGGSYTGDISFGTAEVIWDSTLPDGQTRSVSGSGTVDISPTYGKRSMTYSGTVTAGANGTANGQPLIRIAVNLTMSATVDGITFNIPYNVTFWLGEGIGIVIRTQDYLTYTLSGINGPDRDGDGVTDALDKFPDNAAESHDFDNDGIGDNADTDDDNDGVVDTSDAFPLNASESADFDGDGAGDNSDPDIDNDGVANNIDPYPRNPSRWEYLINHNGGLLFSGVYGSSETPPAQTLQITAQSAHWQVTQKDSWITLNKLSGVGGESLVATVATNLAIGAHNGSITVVDTDTLEQATIGVNATMNMPTLTSDVDSISFDASYGWENITTQNVAFNLNTGSNSYPITQSITFDKPNAIAASLSHATVAQSPESATLTLNPQNMSEGNFSGQLIISANVNGTTISKSIALNAKAAAHSIFASDDGIGFASFPGIARLSQTISIRDSYRLTNTHWSASSNQPWLLAPNAGSSSSNITVSANPAGLTTNTVHYGAITFTPDDPAIPPTVVRVALWVGTNDPTTTASLALQYTNVTADPIRPYIYVTKGGTNIDIYNIYTRALVGTISSAGNSLGQIKISSDGSFLYVLDVGSAEIVRINLDDPTLRTHWPFAGYVFTYARPMGHPSLILDSGALVDANNGHVTAAFPPIFYGTGELNASQDGTRFCGIDSGLSPYSIYCYDLAYSSLNGGQYRATATNNYWAGSVGSNGKDVALNANGSKLYAAGGAPYAFAEYSLPSVQFTQYLNGDAYPNCIEISDDGTIFGGIAGYYGPKDLWIYNSDGSLRKSAYLSGYAQTIVDRQLTVSGESLMAIVLTTDPAIVFLRAD